MEVQTRRRPPRPGGSDQDAVAPDVGRGRGSTLRGRSPLERKGTHHQDVTSTAAPLPSCLLPVARSTITRATDAGRIRPRRSPAETPAWRAIAVSTRAGHTAHTLTC